MGWRSHDLVPRPLNLKSHPLEVFVFSPIFFPVWIKTGKLLMASKSAINQNLLLVSPSVNQGPFSYESLSFMKHTHLFSLTVALYPPGLLQMPLPSSGFYLKKLHLSLAEPVPLCD